jgi:hypothetical protein
VVLFVRGGGAGWSWYYVAGTISLALTLTLITEAVYSRVERRGAFRVFCSSEHIRVLEALVALLILVLGTGRAWGRYVKAVDANAFFHGQLQRAERWQYDVAYWMKNNLAPGSAVYVYDCAGMIAYWSDLRILPVDGLINSYEYSDDMLRLGINRYLQLNNVNYYLGPAGDSAIVHAPLSHQYAGTIPLRNSNMVVRFHAVVANPGVPDLGLWRLHD